MRVATPQTTPTTVKRLTTRGRSEIAVVAADRLARQKSAQLPLGSGKTSVLKAGDVVLVIFAAARPLARPRQSTTAAAVLSERLEIHLI